MPETPSAAELAYLADQPGLSLADQTAREAVTRFQQEHGSSPSLSDMYDVALHTAIKVLKRSSEWSKDTATKL